MMKSMDYIVALVICSACALALVVLFNLCNISITERVREIATVKVLGFYRGETRLYVFREVFLLTFLGAAVGLPVFFLLRKSVSSTAASMLMMGVMLPFFMFGIYEKNGQPLETVLRQMVETKWLRPRRRPYETDNTYAALEREMRLRKEVKALEEQAKKARR